MFYKSVVALFVGIFLMVAPVSAQTPTGPAVEEQEVVPASVGTAVPASAGEETFMPSRYGITEFEEPTDLYLYLTQPGRCPVKVMAPERQPCAFIMYERVSGEGRKINFKPVFKVESQSVIWVMHDRQLKKVSVQNLFSDKVTVRGQKAEYYSFGVVGNAEDKSNCESGRGCLQHLAEQNMFLMYPKIPELVVDKLWRNKMIDNGTVVVR